MTGEAGNLARIEKKTPSAPTKLQDLIVAREAYKKVLLARTEVCKSGAAKEAERPKTRSATVDTMVALAARLKDAVDQSQAELAEQHSQRTT